MQSNASSDVANIFGDTRGSLRAHLPRFVDLVSDLAANVAKESSDSSVQFIGHLNQIEETLIAERRKSEESIQHLGNLEHVIIENGEDQETLKQNMQKAIDVGTFVRNEIEQSRQAISSIAISIDGVKQELSEIVNFSRQIKMIAINASIASARAGAAGREFSVISSEVRRLASETESVIDRLGPLVQGAIKELKSALVRQPNNSVLTINYANALIENEELQEAVRVLQRYTHDNPNDTNGWHLLSKVNINLGNSDEDLAARAEILALQANWNKAIQYYTQASQIAELGSLKQARYDARIDQLMIQRERFLSLQ